MKILYHHRIASKDGQYVHVEELINSLRNLGHEVIVVGPAVVEKHQFGSKGGHVHLLKKYMPKFIYELLEFSYTFYAFIKLTQAIRKHRPDVLYERYNLYNPAGVWVHNSYKIPMLLEINAPLFDERKKYDGIAIPWLARWTENYTWKGADITLPVTKVLSQIVKRAGVNDNNIHVIHNGVNLTEFSNTLEMQKAKHKLMLENKIVLGFTGFVRSWHKLDKVIEFLAANDRHNYQLLIVGDGPAREMLEQKAKEMGVTEKVTITGIVERKDINKYISSFDVALQPAVVKYASPLKLFEYMVMERAIVAPKEENILEILTDGKDAILFDQNDDISFINAIKKLCDNKELRKVISQNARSTILEKNYTWDNNAKTVIKLFKSLLP